MDANTKRKVLSGVIDYILANEPLTYEALHERAQTKAWYDRDLFDRLMQAVAKDWRISATVHDKTIIYRRKQKRTVTPRYRIPCPPLIPGVNDGSHEVFDAMCFCYQVCDKGRAEEMWERQIKKIHKENCYLYGKQRIENPDTDTKLSQEQGSLLLAL